MGLLWIRLFSTHTCTLHTRVLYAYDTVRTRRFLEFCSTSWNAAVETNIQMESTPGGRHVQSLLRALRSTGPKEILLKLVTNREELQQQLCAVMVQALYRGFRARTRAQKLRNNLFRFHKLTAAVMELMVEEFIISSALELAINVHRVNNRYSSMARAVDESIEAEVNSILDSVVSDLTKESVGGIVSALSDALVALNKQHKLQILVQQQMMNAPRQRDLLLESSNPLIRTMLEMLHEQCRIVAVSAIEEEVERYLARVYSQRLAPTFIEEVVSGEVLRLLLDEVSTVEDESLMRAVLEQMEREEVATILKQQRYRRALQQSKLLLFNDKISPRSEAASSFVWKNVADAMLRRILVAEEQRSELKSPVLSPRK